MIYYDLLLELKFDNDRDLLSYYKVMMNNKKLNDDELNEYLIFYSKLKNQLERLKELNKHEKINNALNNFNYTSGYNQSNLKKELLNEFFLFYLITYNNIFDKIIINIIKRR